MVALEKFTNVKRFQGSGRQIHLFGADGEALM
jgi:hypothetical protein